MNLEGVTIKLLLTEENKELALSSYSELKPDYFTNTFKAVLRHIKELYDTKGQIPSMQELEVFRSRDRKTLSAIASISLIDTKDVDIRVAIDELANQSAQNVTLDMLDELLQDISYNNTLDSNIYLPKFIILQTGGSALGETSTRSKPSAFALMIAILVNRIPSCSPSSSMTRTEFALISSFFLIRFFEAILTS